MYQLLFGKIIIVIFIPMCEFFSPVLSGGFSLKSYNIIAEGFRFLAFGFSLAENLSAQYMGYLGATLTQVFTLERASRANVSLRDVTIAQLGNGG